MDPLVTSTVAFARHSLLYIILKVFLKNFNFFYFKLIFFLMFLNYLDTVILKIIFKK